ncbi:hypothetical protein AKJ09_04998 [Labilithrix luteola]|uniref:Uncharacterized protein n=1 Tax=Labilithrix luteola TaxID=1391654 RepID=A0A0K1PYV7_9BACT|nr:hypothetical protein [Labilithrix luteola]AKU98334.1 hypothetical protein AKJ09_04998 [Labilithrix luteola]
MVQHPDAPPRVRIAATVALTGASATEADRVRLAELASDLADSPIGYEMQLVLDDDAELAEVLVALPDRL